MKNNFATGLVMGFFLALFIAIFSHILQTTEAAPSHSDGKPPEFARVRFGFNPNNASQSIVVIEGRELRISNYKINKTGSTNLLTLDIPFSEVDFQLYATSDTPPMVQN